MPYPQFLQAGIHTLKWESLLTAARGGHDPLHPQVFWGHTNILMAKDECSRPPHNWREIHSQALAPIPHITSLLLYRHQRRICPDNEIWDCHIWLLSKPIIRTLFPYCFEPSYVQHWSRRFVKTCKGAARGWATHFLVPLQNHFKERNNMSGRCQQLTVPTRRDLTYFSLLQWLL